MSKGKAEVATRREVDLVKTIAISTPTGELKMYRNSFPLTIESGALVKPRGMPVTLCTAEGYKLQAKYGGLIADMMPTVIVDGVEQGNPYVMRDDKGKITMVYCRAFCFGYTPMGVPTVVSKTVVFDIKTYELVDLLAKAKQRPREFMLRPIDMKPSGTSWAKYPIDDSTAIFCNTECTEFTDWMVQIMNRKRKAVEIAQTFALRNAIKSHPNVQFHKVNNGGASAMVNMTCWFAKTGEMRWDRSQYDTFADTMTQAVSGESTSVQGVDAGTDNLHEIHEEVEAEANTTEMDEHSTPPTDQESDQPPVDPERANYAAIIDGLRKKASKHVAKAAKDCGVAVDADLSKLPMAKLAGWASLAADYAAQDE